MIHEPIIRVYAAVRVSTHQVNQLGGGMIAIQAELKKISDCRSFFL